MRRMLAALGLAALSCAQVQVTTEVEPGVDLDRLQTYDLDAPVDADDEVQRLILGEIGRRMNAKGYQRVAREDADMVVAFRTSRATYSRRQLSPDPDANYYVVRSYIEGTLVIDVYERETKTTLWRGVGQIDFQREKDARRRAPQVVAAILAEFPPDRDEATGS